MNYFAYELDVPLDFHSPYFTIEQMKAMIKRNVDSYIDNAQQLELILQELENAIDDGMRAIYSVSADSTHHEPIKVFPMPSHIPGVAFYGVIIKFYNNGTTFVAVPMDIPYYKSQPFLF
ncbi:hypothetical protein BJM58_12275 [Listeria monocytogenes]|uniref:hypothetical protein n=1 Tax=Listeria monocytogenes TaxID=1639 RepID=UPI000873E76F|nr:hypothetical protein [Listeria monocytogenes]EAD2029785.1 hypothetical protein [Listeria monocytogenes]EGA0596982.1 hypothetical protein [Listeria monocytogenes]OFG33642.1 hypothetical protein BJM58_12275 [Listeria monocytogenes]